MATDNDDASSSADYLHPFIEDEWPIEKKGSKAVKKTQSTSDNECAECSKLIALQGLLLIERASRMNEADRLRDVINTLRDEVDTLRDEVDMLRDEATVREMEHKSNC